jgi:hypothetical protein
MALGQGRLKILNLGGWTFIHPKVGLRTILVPAARLEASWKDGLWKLPPESLAWHEAHLMPAVAAFFNAAVRLAIILNLLPAVISEI